MIGKHIVHKLTSFAAIFFVIAVFTPPSSVKVHGNKILPAELERFNKTIRKSLEKKKFLRLVQAKLDKQPHRSIYVFEPRSQISHFPINQSHQTHAVQPSRNSSRSVEQQKYVDGVVSPQNLIYAKGSENNVLTFTFDPAMFNNSLVTRLNLFIYVWVKEPKRKSSSTESPSTRDLKATNNRRGRRKVKNLKIRVFSPGAGGSRGQRIAELKTPVPVSTWGKLGLPINLMKTISSEEGKNTLRLRVQCKKCNRRTQLIMPEDSSKRCAQKIHRRMLRRRKRKEKRGKRENPAKEEKRMRRWRKNCPQVRAGLADGKKKPFIVIEEKKLSSPSRNKRAPKRESGVSSRFEPVKNTAVPQRNSTQEEPQCCSTSKTYIDFSDLNLQDLIVSPAGFDYLTCTGIESESTISVLRKQKHKSPPSNGSESMILPLLTSHNVTSFRRLLNRHHSQQHHQKQHHDHWHNHKWSRLKAKTSCQPIESDNLVILHFNHDQDLVQSEIPNLLTTKCGCKEDLAPARE